MIYEIRTYTLKPGAVPEFEKRFEVSLTNRLKHSELAAFWHTDIGPLNQVIHVWPYENLQQRTEIRNRAVQEPDWPPDTAELIVSMKSEIFAPAPFSPKLGGGRKLGDIYEMRIYQYQPGSMSTVIERWREALAGGESGRFKLPFPTTRNLIKLGKQPSVKDALADSRGKNVVTVMPVMTRLNGGRQLRIPKEAGYDGELFEVGAQG